MFSYTWDEITSSLCCIKHECIDKEKILYLLDLRYDYDSEVLDRLYDVKAITVDEYVRYMEKIVKQDETRKKHDKERIKDAKEKREEFNPMVYYGFGGYGVI